MKTRMTSFFPDLNVWIALSVKAHTHHAAAWRWLEGLPGENRLLFSRYTQLGFLRLLTNVSAMGEQVLRLGEAWAVYDRWIQDPRVEFSPEPRGVDSELRQATATFSGFPASKTIGDCYLLAFAKESESALVTFDQALLEFASRNHCAAVRPE